MPDYGFDTASTVTNTLASEAVGQFGNGFWIRYFSPSPAANVINSSKANAQAEVAAMFDNGAHHLGVVSEPTQSRLGTSGSTGTSYGTQDATTLINSILNVMSWLGLSVPSSGLWCYLGLEEENPLSSAYWNAWAEYINQYDYGGEYPFFAGLYCSPPAAPPNCSTIAAAPSTATCWGVWSSEPEPCAGCTATFGTIGWDADNCSGFSTYQWQYSEKGSCLSTCGKTINANVDLDEAATDLNALDTMFYFDSAL
jgi:hypothetical protein